MADARCTRIRAGTWAHVAMVLAGVALAAGGCANGALPGTGGTPDDGPDAGADPSHGCPFRLPGASPGPALAFASGFELKLLAGDGSSRSLFEFASGTPDSPDRIAVYPLLARAGLIVAEAVWARGSATATREVALVELDGTVRWTMRRPGISPMAPELGPGGVLVVQDGERQAVVVDERGQARTLAGLSPIGPPGLDGRIAVRPVDLDQPGGFGWYQLQTGDLAPLGLPLFADAVPQYAGDRLLYIGDRGGAPVVVSERYGDERITDLAGAVQPGDKVYLHVEEGVVRLEIAGSAHRTVHFDPVTGTIEAINGLVPAGLRPWVVPSGPQVDDTGAVLMPLRDAYRGGMYRAASPGGALALLGRSVSDVLVIGAGARAGTYLIGASNDSFGGETDWQTPGPGAGAELKGPSLQIVRPAEGIVRTLALDVDGAVGNLFLRADGRCGVFISNGSGPSGEPHRLEAYDVIDGRRIVLDSGPQQQTAFRPSWIE